MILPFDITKTTVWTQMQTAITLMSSVASGKKPIQLVCSPTGFGKTSIAKAECQRHGIRFERPEDRVPAMRSALRGIAPEQTRWKLAIETRPKKVISLVRVLYRCSVLNAAFLLFDDPGRVAQDEDACDILKTCFGMQRMVMYETPEITRNELWKQSGHGGYDPFIPPPEFPVPPHLRWLWLSNTNYTDPAILAKLGDHFAPLIARGLNPYWVGDDREHDNYDLFLYVYHKATEENLLRSMGFPYAVSRQAVNFYITHANTLIDLCPRRLELIARAFAANVPQEVRDSELESMAPTTGGDSRPKLKLPASWVTVPDGKLFWPVTPFKKHKTPSPENPNPDPDPEPPPPPTVRDPAPADPIDPGPDPEPQPQPIPASPAVPPGRTAILQDIAKMLRGRIYNARIIGAADKLHVNGHDDSKQIFIIADWLAHPDITTEFALEIANQREAKELREMWAANGITLDKGHIVINETRRLRDMAKINEPAWPVTVGQEANAQLIATCKSATGRLPIGVDDDGRLSFSDTEFCYDRGNLEWSLKKDWTSLSVTAEGIIKVVVPGVLGDYLIYLRGMTNFDRPTKPEPAQAKPDQIDDPAPEPADNVVPFVPTAKAAPNSDLMDQPIPPIGQRRFTGECPEFFGRVGKDDGELAVLRAYVMDIVRQTGLSPDELRRTPKKFWMMHRHAKSVREIWDAR